jgi:catechol 2,3-dioxygenase-like lactoylglutathione lyase family enzyme
VTEHAVLIGYRLRLCAPAEELGACDDRAGSGCDREGSGGRPGQAAPQELLSWLDGRRPEGRIVHGLQPLGGLRRDRLGGQDARGGQALDGRDCPGRLVVRAGPNAIIRRMPLNHVALTVSDREQSAAFYGEHFGLTERIHEDEQRLILGSSSGDGCEPALSEGTPAAAALPHTNHFGFRLADDAAVRAARERFRAAGVVEVDWQDDGRFVRVQVFDPDGYRVEVYAH